MTNFKSAVIAERLPASLEAEPHNASFEIQNIIESERMFLVVLAIMTSVLGAICVYFVLNL